MEKEPIYVLAVRKDFSLEISPTFESPLRLLTKKDYGEMSEKELNIPERYLKNVQSPWLVKRLKKFGGDLNQFKVLKIQPSILEQIAITKTEPGDENNQDISTLVGKLDICKLEHYSQDDTDAYSYSGALCRSNQGLLEFVEMFKAPFKVLHPLLTATQEGHYKGTEQLPAIPFDGVILAHSNESEWETFKNNKHNEALLDRIYIVKVPYCLRIDEEVKIYEKLLHESSLNQAPCAPHTLELLAQLAVFSRLKDVENSSKISKMKIYNGENIKQKDPRARSIYEYRQEAGDNEGMDGISTRFAFKVLSRVFNYDMEEVAANPVHLLHILQTIAETDIWSDQQKEEYLSFINGTLVEKYAKFIGGEIQQAYLDSYSEYGQNIFDRYITYADFWIQGNEYRDPENGTILNPQALNEELESIEKPAGIANPKDFRNEMVNLVLRHRANHKGENPRWNSYEKIRQVIEAKMFAKTDDLLPIISFGKKGNKNDEEKHQNFVSRMVENGYTEKQVKLLVEWYIRVQKSQ
jgi:serine protein kinase